MSLPTYQSKILSQVNNLEKKKRKKTLLTLLFTDTSGVNWVLKILLLSI